MVPTLATSAGPNAPGPLAFIVIVVVAVLGALAMAWSRRRNKDK